MALRCEWCVSPVMDWHTPMDGWMTGGLQITELKQGGTVETIFVCIGVGNKKERKRKILIQRQEQAHNPCEDCGHPSFVCRSTLWEIQWGRKWDWKRKFEKRKSERKKKGRIISVCLQHSCKQTIHSNFNVSHIVYFMFYIVFHLGSSNKPMHIKSRKWRVDTE